MFSSFVKQDKDTPAKVIALKPSVDLPKVEPANTPSIVEQELIKRLELKSRLHDALLDRLNLAIIDKVDPEELRR